MRISRIGKFGFGAIALGVLFVAASVFLVTMPFSNRYWGPLGSTYSELLALVTLFGSLLIAAGIILVLSPRARQPESGVPNSFSAPEELIVADLRVPYASANRYSRFPLGRKFAGMPHVALMVCGVLILLLCISWILAPLPPMGHYVYVRRPASAHLLAGVAEDPVIVVVRRDPSPTSTSSLVYVNSQRVEWPNLGAAIRTALVRHVDRVVYIEGDNNLPYQDIAEIVGIARKAWPGVPIVLKTPGIDGGAQKIH